MNHMLRRGPHPTPPLQPSQGGRWGHPPLSPPSRGPQTRGRVPWQCWGPPDRGAPPHLRHHRLEPVQQPVGHQRNPGGCGYVRSNRHTVSGEYPACTVSKLVRLWRGCVCVDTGLGNAQNPKSIHLDCREGSFRGGLLQEGAPSVGGSIKRGLFQEGAPSGGGSFRRGLRQERAPSESGVRETGPSHTLALHFLHRVQGSSTHALRPTSLCYPHAHRPTWLSGEVPTSATARRLIHGTHRKPPRSA